MKTLLCYGDSNTYGYDPQTGGRYENSKRWTTILAKKLGPDYVVVSEGLNGRTTAYDSEDVAWKNGLPYFAPCIASNKPVDIICIMLGTNDCNKNLNLEIEDISAGMEKLICTVIEECPYIQGYIPKIIIVTPAPILGVVPESPFAEDLDEYSIKKSQGLAKAYKLVAEKYGCGFVDCNGMVEISPTDAEHLTEKGHQQIADLLYNEIISLDKLERF